MTILSIFSLSIYFRHRGDRRDLIDTLKILFLLARRIREGRQLLGWRDLKVGFQRVRERRMRLTKYNAELH